MKVRNLLITQIQFMKTVKIIWCNCNLCLYSTTTNNNL